MSQNYSNYILDLPTVTSQADNGESKHPMSICSCSLCDSNSCFKIRNDLAPCTCESCNPTKTCSRSSKCVFILQSESKKNKPIPQQQIVWVPDTQNDKVLVKKLESERETKQRKEQEKEQRRYKEKERKIDLQPERDTVQKRVSKKELSSKESFYQSTRNKNSDFDIRNTIRYKYKDKTDVKKRENYYEKCITQTESVAITIANKERERSKAELSAQIMNVPYQQFKDCLALNKTKTDQRPFNNIISEIIKPDILTRLKEIYKACSCKVCECITGKSFSSNNNCTCKPCECNDCLNILKMSKSDDKRPHSGCPCVSCDRKDCRGVVKKTEIVKECDCKSCDCVKYSGGLKTPCDCEPCHCAECATSLRGPKQLILAHMQETFRSNMCQCELCECLNCTHNYTSIANANVRQSRPETSTNISYANCQCGNCLNDVCQFEREVCRCDQNRVMRKPIERSNRDYDIRATFTNNKQSSSKYYKKYDTYAMFTLAENYSKTLFRNRERKKSCQCTDCDCMICDKENIKNSYKTMHNNLPYDIFDYNSDSCNCLPCECKICTINRYAERNLLQRGKKFNRACNCTMCECIICEGLNCDGDSLRNEVDTNISIPRDILRKESISSPPCFATKISLPSCMKSQSSDYGLQRHKEKKVQLKISTEPSSQKILDENLPFHNTQSKHIDSNSIEKVSSDYLSLSDKVSSLNNAGYDKTFNTISKHNLKLRKTNENSNLLANHSDVCNITRNSLYDTDICEQSFCAIETLPSTGNILTNDAEASNSLQNITEKYIKRETEYLPKIKVPTLTELKDDDIKNSSRIPDSEFYRYRLLFNKPSMLSIFKSSSKSLTVCTKLSTTLKNEEAKYELNFELYETNTAEDCITLKPLHELTNYNGMDHLIDPETRIKSNEINNLAVSENSYTTNIQNVEPINFDKLSQKSEIKEKYKNKPNKMYRRLLKRSLVRRTKKKNKQIKNPSFTPKENINQINSRDKLVHNDVVTSVNSFFDSQFDLLKKMKMEIQDMGTENIKNSVLRKNLYLNYDKARQHKSVWTVPDLENDAQRTVESASSQVDDYCDNFNGRKILNKNLNLALKNVYDNATSQTFAKTLQVEKETNCNLLQTLDNLKKSMRSCLEQALTYTVDASDDKMTKLKPNQNVEWEFPKFKAEKSSCLSLKANFVNVKRISGHTVLVRWEVPQDLTNVKGYELQVDGRPIQKIFSPMRSMAVITCLPHCDKLLLTIRTITTTDLPLDHYPASTMVYRARCK